jgi:hypothetical protein
MYLQLIVVKWALIMFWLVQRWDRVKVLINIMQDFATYNQQTHHLFSSKFHLKHLHISTSQCIVYHQGILLYQSLKK